MQEPILDEAAAILRESQQPKLSLEQQIRHFSSAELPSDSIEVDPSQTKITPTQRSLIALMVRGFNLAAACRQLSINYAAAHRWSKQEWFEAECEIERQKWLVSQGIDKKAELFLPLVGQSMQALQEMLASDDEKVRLGAVQFVFSQFLDDKPRMGRPPKPREDVEEPIDLSVLRARAAQKVADDSEQIRKENPRNVNVVSNG